VSGTI